MDNTFGWNNHANTLLDDPSFVDAANHDFHLEATSLAIDRCAMATQPPLPAAGQRTSMAKLLRWTTRRSPMASVNLTSVPMNTTPVM
ncbi:hypothetical protein [Marinicella meishanensis]|uniref:hypothetical protein n=1 Tax=Marinicella meishanensis TaxID=2873263 RepID=UPI001CC0BDEA|nr:hypothetical protein [Marinicella sp. NBU2979]